MLATVEDDHGFRRALEILESGRRKFNMCTPHPQTAVSFDTKGA